jgi:ribosome maturation factor RimP
MVRVEEKVAELAREVAVGLGYEIDEIELLGSGRRTLLRVAIEKEGGVTIDDCSLFSRDLSALLDVEDPIPGHYTLEVSSPGLDRPLREPRHFRRHTGKRARVVVREKVEGANVILGVISDASDKAVRLVVEGREVDIPYENISRARLEIALGGTKGGESV